MRFLLLFAGLFLLGVAAGLSGNPVLTLGDAFRLEASGNWWLLLLFWVEFLRQAHLLALDRSSSYRTFYVDRFVARADQFLNQFDHAQRYHVGRALGWFLAGYLALFVFARAVDTTVLAAIVDLPLLLWSAVPFATRAAAVSLAVLVPAAVACWLVCRSGATVYPPTAVTTRYRDVWGQDHVLAGIREKISQVTHAKAIEQRGGRVSAGIVLWGPAGTGKTLVATAAAGETGSPLVVVDLGVFSPARFGPGLGRLKVTLLVRRVRRLGARYGSAVVIFERLAALDGDRGGTLAALSAELPVTSQPRTPVRGLANRIRRAFGAPCSPARYWTLLVAVADEPSEVPAELLRPGRFDRWLEVGVPDRQGRERLLAGYLSRVRHTLSAGQVRALATAIGGATGESVRQLVDDALAIAFQAGREVLTWSDVRQARLSQVTPYGLGDQRAYGAAERHSLALHQACHAVLAYRLCRAPADRCTGSTGEAEAAAAAADLVTVTIECRDPGSQRLPGGEVDDRVHPWNSEVELQVMVSLASLAGERMFYDGDNSAAVAGDLRTATALVCRHLSATAFGQSLASRAIVLQHGLGDEGPAGGRSFSEQVDARLGELYARTETVLAANRRWVLALAHALETHQVLAGDDVDAVVRGTVGPTVDGRRYHDPAFLAVAEAYHAEAVCAHRGQPSRGLRLPELHPPDRGAAS